jgi:hypothetical protein
MSRKRLRGPVRGATLVGMDKPGHYWDADECAWVRFPPTTPPVEIPAQQTPVEAEQEADVRSG